MAARSLGPRWLRHRTAHPGAAWQARAASGLASRPLAAAAAAPAGRSSGASPFSPAGLGAGLGARGIVLSESIGTVVQVGKNHWTSFMYGRERQLLEYVVGNVEEGDTQGVLAAMDDFWAHHFGMKGTDSWSIRKDMLDATLKEKGPTRCLELGTYCGYSALRIAQALPSEGKLVSLEVDPLFSAISTKIIEYAGQQGKVKVLTGTVETRIKRLKECLVSSGQSPDSAHADFVLCDHSKERFVPDLELLEQWGVLGPGTTVMGDTTLYPGEESCEGGANLLTHFASSDKYRVAQHVGTDRSSGITVCEWQHMV